MGGSMGKSSSILDALPSQSCHVVMLGLDSAGKTTALYRLKFEQYLNTVPTIGFNCEKVQGNMGKAKGVQFLIWDVGGQEKLRPLWRSYTRCTDGILFVVDSVDTERMEEAKMELMRTAKCPDNQGVPVLILANKQDLPGACNPKDLEKLLGLYELIYDFKSSTLSKLSTASNSSGNIVGGTATINSIERSLTPTNSHFYQPLSEDVVSNFSSSSSLCEERGTQLINLNSTKTTASPPLNALAVKNSRKCLSHPCNLKYKGWYIQPTCAITGEGLQEGLDALYQMILKRRKLCKPKKKIKR